MAETRTPPVVDWYRTSIPSDVFKRLHQRSDAKALVYTLGFLGVYAATATAAFLSWRHHEPWYVTVLLVFLHGMVASFLTNGMHELGHGTVFKTKALNEFFLRVVSFLGWLHPDVFTASHQRHHRYTLHAPDDQEVVLPVKLMLKHFLEQSFINPRGMKWMFLYTLRLAAGRFQGEWELVCYPPDQPQLRRIPIRWARIVLAGHVLIAAVSLYFGLWIIPVLISLTPMYGGWLFFLCNNTQHIGLQDKVPDFRLCCRTVLLSPPVGFLFWQMHYHMEHHMFAAVPCYNLKELHAAIRHDVPTPPNGLVESWRHIISVLRRQAQEPTYQYVAVLPATAGGQGIRKTATA
jgi:fatty acid desaturase